MAGVEFKAKGFSQAILNIEGRKSKLANFTAFHKKVAIVVLGWVFKNFQKDGGLHDDSSLKWPALSPATIARRRQGSPQILRDTGRLRGGFESKANRSQAVISNAVVSKKGFKYGQIHEEGLFGIPQRKMFPETDQAEDIVRPVMVAHIRKSIK